MRLFRRIFASIALAAPFLAGQVTTGPTLLEDFEWRSIGPAVMGGRIADIVGVAGDPTLVYVAAASGGLFRTRDGGITWTPLFDHQSTISIGAIAVEPGNPNVIWVVRANRRSETVFRLETGCISRTMPALHGGTLGCRSQRPFPVSSSTRKTLGKFSWPPSVIPSVPIRSAVCL
jgi:hypothetical protein